MFFRRWRNFFQFIVLKGILLDPFVTQAIEYEISQAIQNVDGTVVVATVGGLQKGIESVEIAIGHLCQPNIFFLVLQTCIFMEVAAKTIILVGGQLRDSYADLFLSLLAIKHQLGQQHTNLLAGTFQPLFDFDGITLEPFGLQGTVDLDDFRSEIVDVGIYFIGESVSPCRSSFGGIPLIDRRTTLGINLFGDPIDRDSRHDRRRPVLHHTIATQEERNEESFSVQHFQSVFCESNTIEKLGKFCANKRYSAYYAHSNLPINIQICHVHTLVDGERAFFGTTLLR